MPCHHRFCGGCIEKWLRAHGSCPVCRYEMPVEEDEKAGNEEGGESRGGIWVGFAVGIERNES
ncbi:E3 ubiquitin-protein ligase mpsr1 [Castilleja foliolosa]|uniref:RING-type E3 ubiquitin transferase n=1 Tax=Castilleja foliolosa TaxID=1961234 RepID=A0ABD3CPA1_9LAMI